MIDQLLMYDFTSSKKGNRLGNLLLDKKKTGAKNIQRHQQYEEPNDPEEEKDVIHPPAGGNTKIWYDKLTPA